MIEPAQPERARRFLDLHRGPAILVLPNAWDAASARLFEEEGFSAIATTRTFASRWRPGRSA